MRVFRWVAGGLLLWAGQTAAVAGPSEKKVNNDAGGIYQGYSDCAVTQSGDFIVVWEDARMGGNDIYLQRYDSAGNSVGPNARVNDSISPEQFAPAVAVDTAGVYWIVWQDFRASGYPQDGDIYLQRVRSDGTRLGVNTLVNDDGALVTQKEPHLAINGDEALIVWSDLRNGGWDIYSQRYDLNGTPLGWNQRLNDETNAAPQHAPQVSALVDQRFAVVWYDTRSGNEDVFVQLMSDTGGTLVGGNVLASSDATGSGQRFPAVAAGPESGFTVVWQDYRDGQYPIGSRLYQQQFDSAANKLSSDQPVDSGNYDQFRPRLSSDAAGNRVLVWEENEDGRRTVWHQICPMTADTPFTPVRFGDDTTSDIRTRPNSALGPDGAVFTWTDDRNGDFDIYVLVEEVSLPTFFATPGQLLFSRPIRTPAVTLFDTVSVVATGSGPRLIGWNGLPPWLSVLPIQANTPADFEITFDGATAPLDTTITIEAVDLGSPTNVEHIVVDVQTVAPLLVATPSAVLLEVTPGKTDSLPVVISNAEPGPLVWHHELEPSDFDARREGPDTVWVLIKTSQPKIDTLRIVDSLATNSPLAVPLAAEDNLIPPVPPYLIVTPPVVAWTAPSGQATADSATVLIEASYDTAISFNIIDYPAWLYIDVVSGTVPQAMFLRAAYDSIPFGVYEDTVLIEAPDASNSPYALPIIFTADVHSGAGHQETVVSADLRIRPNPFNDNVLIEWASIGATPVTLSIYDVLGRQVHQASDQDGLFRWSPGSGLASGTYLIRMSNGGEVRTRRLLYLK